MTLEQITEIARLQRLSYKLWQAVLDAAGHPQQRAWLLDQITTTNDKICQLQNQ